MRRPIICWLAAFAGALAACGDNTTAVCSDFAPDAEKTGRVYVDFDGDGSFSDGDEPAANARVFFETALCTTTDLDGRYALPAQPDAGIVWVRGEDDWAPGPHWKPVPASQTISVDIAIGPQLASGPLSFVLASDTHAGISLMGVEDQILGLAQATARGETPYFIAVTGDLTQSNKPEHFAAIGEAIAAIDVPYVPVPGNHDWYDGGGAYRDYFGPPMYSFDTGGFHFVVLNDLASISRRLDFLDRTIRLIDDGRGVVVMMHAPPRAELLAELEERDIDYLLTGHLHANRVLQHQTFIEYNTQPLVMGGIDLTPGGFRVLRVDDSGGFAVEHHNTVNEPIAVVTAPSNNQIMAPCEARITASVQSFAATASVLALVEGIGAVPMTARGGWVYATDALELCDVGTFAATVTVTDTDGATVELDATLEVGVPAPLPIPPDWSVFQGNAEHTGRSDWTGAFPDIARWSGAVGGHAHGGSPIVSGGRVFVSVSDFGDGRAGGVVAFDAVSGAVLWEHRVGFSVPHAAAASGDRLLFNSNDGATHCVDAATGEALWTYELAPGFPPEQRNLYTSPTLVGDVVFTGGRHELAALDIGTGEVIWSVEPFSEFGHLPSHSSPAAAGGIVVIPFDRSGGLRAYDAELGTELWRTPNELTLGIQASPVIVGDTVYVINELMALTALDLLTGETRWARTIEADSFDWAYASSATPTVGDGQLFIATQRGALIAVDINTGAEQWTYTVGEALIRATHYHGRTPALSAAPTWTPGRVWLPSTDGTLRVIDSRSGQELWSLDLGVPATASVALAGDIAFVATYDGVIRALSSTR